MMLELIGMFWLTRTVARVLAGKGYSRRLAGLVPAVWIMTEMAAVLGVMSVAPDTNIVLLSLIGVVAGASSGLVTYSAIKRLEPKSAADVGREASGLLTGRPAPASPVASQSDHQALAGYCDECDEIVWLTPEGGCENGHSQDSISGVHWALR